MAFVSMVDKLCANVFIVWLLVLELKIFRTYSNHQKLRMVKNIFFWMMMWNFEWNSECGEHYEIKSMH